MLALRGIFLLLASLCNGQAIPATGCTLKAPLPSGDICGIAGRNPVFMKGPPAISGYYSPYKQPFPSLAQCRDFCLRRFGDGGPYPSDCINFRYNASSSACVYQNKALLSITEDPSSNVVFYNRSCFDCPAPCSQQAGVNLLDNGGFELSAHLLAPWNHGTGNSKSRIVKGGAYGTSNRAHQCTKNNLGCRLEQGFVGCTSTIYQFSFDYRAEPRGSDHYYALIEFSDTYFTLNVPNGSTAYNWTTFNSLVTLSHGTQSVLYLPKYIDFNPLSKNEIAEADNFALVPTSYTFDTVPGATDILINGDFETGLKAPWDIEADAGTARVVSPGINSAYALQFNPRYSGNHPPYLFLNYNLSDTGHTIAASTPYKLSFNYAFKYSNVYFGLLVSLEPQPNIGNNAAWIQEEVQRTYSNQSGKVEIVFTGQEYAASMTYLFMSFSIDGSGSPDEGTLLLDNFSIKELVQTKSEP